MVVQAALLSPPYTLLSYGLPQYFPEKLWQAGQRVVVPLGKTLRCAVIWDFTSPELETRELKPLFWPLESSPLLTPAYLALIRELSIRYLDSPGRILAAVLPKNLRTAKLIVRVQKQGFPGKMPITGLPGLEPDKLWLLADCWLKGMVSQGPDRTGREDVVYALTLDPPWPIRPQAKRQLRLVERFWEHGPGSREKLKKELGSWVLEVLPVLEKRGLVQKQVATGVVQEQAGSADLKDYVLTTEQNRAVFELKTGLGSPTQEVRLLFGITGSGKTLVYLQLIQECLAKGASAMCLAPELALAWQIWATAKRYFGASSCYLYHGYQGALEREETFRGLATRREPCLVVGTRSAVFLPRSDWGLIILDEEHDSSFKQEERFSYQTREVAFYLSQQCRALLLLGSATPDMKTYFAAKQQVFPLIRLQNRVGQGSLPAVELVDLQKQAPNSEVFCPKVHEELLQGLGRGEQAIILLNRRGYSPLVYCTSCSQVVKCGQCAVGMTFHKNRQRLVCHYCGLTKPFPLPCPECGGHQYVPLDEGTEQVEEYLRSWLDPDVGVLRLDRDSTRRKGSLEDILYRFSRREAGVLVGTQMCSKGHHFPDVTRVIVLDGDIGLNLPDYRATERTFQLLVQVSGRAGRGDRPGKVMIQTRNPNHYCWKHITNNDFEGFYQQEIELRRRFRYPPFVKLALMRFDYPMHWIDGEKQVREIAARLQKSAREAGLEVLGPAPAPLSLLRGRKRFHCLIKAQTWTMIRQICAGAMAANKPGKKLRISLDLDPVQML